eukprot:TRINITY_DN17487_c1_g1_i1.p1 TRINITY_DN17487_c1_g1~~TRINITY_DN17487_c1_g1_i1.p1  ORF type:complete len:115 (+),score=13.51 TRINITY_DN17487_c1_g1_i1:52-345(+)
MVYTCLFLRLHPATSAAHYILGGDVLSLLYYGSYIEEFQLLLGEGWMHMNISHIYASIGNEATWDQIKGGHHTDVIRMPVGSRKSSGPFTLLRAMTE